jgi:hypothetical protein
MIQSDNITAISDLEATGTLLLCMLQCCGRFIQTRPTVKQIILRGNDA